MKEGGLETAVKKDAKGLKEINSAISKQYENKPIELKREPVYTENVKGSDGAYEHEHLKETKVDYSKLFEHMGKQQEKDYQQEAAQEQKKVEERKAEMQVKEFREFFDDYVSKSFFQSVERTSPEDSERFSMAMMFPEGKIWFDYEQATAMIRTKDINISKYLTR